MSISDFILAILVMAAAALILWVYDINPYTNKLFVYTQQCDNMILDNTYCKGNWVDQPVFSFTIKPDNNNITKSSISNTDNEYFNCKIIDRKNWQCEAQESLENIVIKNGFIQYNENTPERQISRMQWLQNKVLNFIH